MTMHIHKSIVTLGALVAMAAFAGQTLAATTPADDLKAARSELSHGKVNAALTNTEMAETALLNLQQAGDKSGDAALDSVQKAHHDLMAKDREAAKADIESALTALGAS